MSESNGRRYRLVTRSDFDGLVCAALLRQIGLVENIKFVHPKDMQDGKVEISGSDVTTNLPYVEGVHLAFDHHPSEELRIQGTADNWVMDAGALSTARVVYDHFGGSERFPQFGEEIMQAVDNADAARFSEMEILRPTGWTLLSFLMDPRTGLGRFHEFRIPNYQLMMELIEACTRLTIDEIFELPDVKERVELYRAHESQAIAQIKRCSTVHDKLVVLDLRDEDVIHPTNRFMVYALFPGCTISIHVIWGLKKQNTVLATGKSIIDRSSPTDVGAMMLEYGGGGHTAAGTCQVENDRVDEVMFEVIGRIHADETQAHGVPA